MDLQRAPGGTGVDQLIVVSKDISRVSNRWHVTLRVEGRLYYSARVYHTALIDAAVAAEADLLREKGCDVRVH